VRVCGVAVVEGSAKGGGPLRWVLVYVHVGSSCGGAFLAKVVWVCPPVACGRSVVRLVLAGLGVYKWRAGYPLLRMMLLWRSPRMSVGCLGPGAR
jgi:hypothetical protein